MIDVENCETSNIPCTSTNQNPQGGGSLGEATVHAYRQAIEANDTDHQLYIKDASDGTKRFRQNALLGDATESFDNAPDIVITNKSGITWPADQEILFRLDRTSLMPSMETAYANPADVPIPCPTTGSVAIGTTILGRALPTDFQLAERGETPSQGALEPS